MPLGGENRRIGTAAPPFKTIEHGKQPGVWVGTKVWRGERAQTAMGGTASIGSQDDDMSEIKLTAKDNDCRYKGELKKTLIIFLCLKAFLNAS